MRKVAMYVYISFCLIVLPGVLRAAGDGDDPFARACELFERGRWSDARTELLLLRQGVASDDEPLLEQLDYRLAVCAVELGRPDAARALDAFVARWPASPHIDRVQLALASYHCSRNDFARAAEAFARVDYANLTPGERERYDIRCGYIAFSEGDHAGARRCLRRIDARSRYADHALYYLTYINYAEGDLDRAERGFRRLESSDAYRSLAPYYLLQIEFRRGNYAYVVDRAGALIEAATPERRAELYRVVAESWFRLDDYPRALAALDDFRKAGGTPGREESYVEGYSLYRLARYGEATAALRAACGPDDALTQNASYHLADCYLRAGDKTSALEAFAMASDGQDAVIAEDALFNYGKLQYEAGGGRFNEAINVLSRYAAAYPSSPRIDQVRTLLAAAYYNSSDYEAAYRAIRRMDAPDADLRAALQKAAYFRALDAYERGDLAEARRSLKESADVAVSQRYVSLARFWQGEIAFAQGDHEAARRLYEDYLARALRTEREYAQSYYGLGYCAFTQHRMADAGAAFDRFLALHAPQDDYRCDALNRRADVCYQQRRFDEAVRYYDQAIATGRVGRYYAQYKRAVTLGIVGRHDEKIAALQAVVAADRGDYLAEASYELGRTYLARERYAEGARQLESFVAAYPHSPRHTAALTDLGLAYLNLGDREKSLACYDRVVRAAPHSAEARDALQAIREIYVGGGDAEAYFAYASGAGVENDLSAVARDSLSFAAAQKLYLADRTEDAERSLRSYVKSFPKGYYLDDALYYLSDCYLSAGRRAEAIDVLTRLTAQGGGQYAVTGLDRLASLCESEERWAVAADAYARLADAASTAAARAEASEGLVRTTLATDDAERILPLADRVAAIPDASERALREARFARAVRLDRAGQSEQALALYETLSVEVRSGEGAESTYRLIEAAHRSGDDERAERMIFAFADKNTPHNDWLARSFLLLGDIYLARGDAFQARATWQSVADGYTPDDDGVVAQARERIAKLKES